MLSCGGTDQLHHGLGNDLLSISEKETCPQVSLFFNYVYWETCEGSQPVSSSHHSLSLDSSDAYVLIRLPIALTGEMRTLSKRFKKKKKKVKIFLFLQLYLKKGELVVTWFGKEGGWIRVRWGRMRRIRRRIRSRWKVMFLFSLIPCRSQRLCLGWICRKWHPVVAFYCIALLSAWMCVYNNSIITESEKAIGKKKHWNSAQVRAPLTAHNRRQRHNHRETRRRNSSPWRCEDNNPSHGRV